MKHFVGCDMHKRYSVFYTITETQEHKGPVTIQHEDLESLVQFFRSFPPNTPVAIETTGYWYWMVDLIEDCGLRPILTHARKAKVMMGCLHKTDKLDARGLALLLLNGSIPSVWIANKAIRGARTLTRHRLQLSKMRSQIKNRIGALFDAYGIRFPEVSDRFGKRGRRLMAERLARLPEAARWCVQRELDHLDYVLCALEAVEDRIAELIPEHPEIELLMTLPGVGRILAPTIWFETGDIARFPRPECYVSYCGLTPRIRASGGKVRYGRLARAVNKFLKWAYIEAANVVSLHAKRSYRGTTAGELYLRARRHHIHARAVVIVARHLARSAYWMLRRGEPYRPRKLGAFRPYAGERHKLMHPERCRF